MGFLSLLMNEQFQNECKELLGRKTIWVPQAYSLEKTTWVWFLFLPPHPLRSMLGQKDGWIRFGVLKEISTWFYSEKEPPPLLFLENHRAEACMWVSWLMINIKKKYLNLYFLYHYSMRIYVYILNNSNLFLLSPNFHIQFILVQ